MSRILLTSLLLLLGLVRPWTAQAEPKGGEGVVNKLLAPGPLILGHQDLEHGDCLKCHDAGQGVPDAKCLSCHNDIQKSIREKDSFHGRHTKPCIACHADHKGRNHDTTAVNTRTFSHGLTGFELRGAHAKADCARCHKDKRQGKRVRRGDTRFFGLDDSCKECHKKDDPHRFPPKLAAKECSYCHNEVAWRQASFDHKKETGYALVGEHAKLACASCHNPKGKPTRYDFPELKTKGCLTCHADHHGSHLSGTFGGGQCDRCHQQTTWSIRAFEHGVTGFALRGKHARVNCVDCHKQSPGVRDTGDKRFHFAGTSETCASCHKDYHGFRQETSAKLGPLTKCQTCHNENGWKDRLAFDHASHTSYPLTGRHTTVACFDCHKPLSGGKSKAADLPRRYEFPTLESKTCETCHKSPHTSSPSSIFRTSPCTTCHDTSGWKNQKASGASGTGGFNHDRMTAFPLTGVHKGVSCKNCHLRGGREVYKLPNRDKEFCVTCHGSPHKGQFDPKTDIRSCATCHDTVAFKNLAQFDHGATEFQLTGAHAKLQTQCQKCHVATTRTLPVKPPRPAGKFQFEHGGQGFCVDCHKNVHEGQFSSRFPSHDCRQCHSTQTFKTLLPFNHNKTKFPLTGSHAKFQRDCDRCHTKTDKMLPTTPPRPAGRFDFPFEKEGFCGACHRNVHQEQFSKEFAGKPCKDCHATNTFAARLPFDHDQTDFKITGAHEEFRTKCSKCHVKTSTMLPTKPPKAAGLFLFPHGKKDYCEACHLNEHRDQFHQKFSDWPCSRCHVTVAFERRKTFDHGLTRFPLKGKHEDVKCEECHEPTSKRFKQSPRRAKGRFIFEHLKSKDCATCHEDPHAGRFGKRCSQCHTEEGWDETGGFHRDFALHGSHLLLECSQCHADRRELQGTGQECQRCHAKDDIHLGSQPECSQCHNQQFWSVSRFQHGMTGFPLRGAHRLADCKDCHAGGVYTGQIAECAACHRQDAAKVTSPDHGLAGFESCGDCHNQFMFRGVRTP